MKEEDWTKAIMSMPSITLEEASKRLKEAMPSREWYKPILKLIEFTVKALHKGLDRIEED